MNDSLTVRIIILNNQSKLKKTFASTNPLIRYDDCRDFSISKFLIGFIPATSGSARVNGYSIDTDISSVRGSLGMCPQHNTLFDNLTVKEQLEFYYKVRRDLRER